MCNHYCSLFLIIIKKDESITRTVKLFKGFITGSLYFKISKGQPVKLEK